MADVVQYRLERMVDELDDLERRGLFSRAEIAEIVRRRTDFEYRLKRPQPIKQDYILYIEYETHLDALRNLRKRAILGRLAEKGEKGSKKWKKSISDVAGVKRILDVYNMAVVRYKGDLDLWFRYLEFCRERRNGKMKQVLAQAIRYHPKVPGLWIYAAAWEFDQNLIVAAARALMQNGLRVCPKSEDLWIEYLRMELTYLNKLKARKLALGEDISTLAKDSKETKQWKEENKDLFMTINDENEQAKELNVQDGALEKKEDLFWQHGSMILETIYHGAVEALPSSMSLHKRFLEILDDVDLAQSDKLKEEIMKDLKQNFSRDEYYWDWMARLQITDMEERKNLTEEVVLSKLNKAAKVFDEALQRLPSTKMFSLYTKFCLEVILAAKENPNSVLSSRVLDSIEFTSRVLKVYEKAEASGCLSKDLAYEYISFYLQMGRIEDARNLAKKLCEGRLSEAANLWEQRVSIEMKMLTSNPPSINDDNLQSILELLENVLRKLPASEAERLWMMAIKLFANQKKHFEKLVQILIMALAKATDSDGGYSIAAAIVNWVLQRAGVKHAREMYKRFLALPHPSLSFFKHCIELESNLSFAGEDDGVANARKLYESALSIHSQSRDLWKDYYMMEMKVGTSETVNAIYWRARKVLKDTIELSDPINL